MRLDQIGTPKPGFYQVHSDNGVTWRSTPPARVYAESILAPKVSHFKKTLESSKTTPLTHSQPFKRVYKIGTAWLEISQQPWENIPTLHIIEEHRP